IATGRQDRSSSVRGDIETGCAPGTDRRSRLLDDVAAMTVRPQSATGGHITEVQATMAVGHRHIVSIAAERPTEIILRAVNDNIAAARIHGGLAIHHDGRVRRLADIAIIT